MSVYQLSNNSLTIKVNSFGAELCSVYSKQFDIEYIWQAKPEIWARHAPHLFPIVGKLKNNSFVFEGKQYTLPQHGFARDLEFICIDKSESFVCFELVANEKSLTNFPFHFSLQIKFELINNTLIIGYEVFNPDNNTLLFSLGAHPAFNCPLEINEKFTDYELVFNTDKGLETTNLVDGLIISNQTQPLPLINKRLPITKQLFDNDALVFCNQQINELSMQSTNTGRGITLNCKDWPYFGIWTKKNTEEFVCLEPWYGIADFIESDGILNNKKGIIKLNTNQKFQSSFTITFY